MGDPGDVATSRDLASHEGTDMSKTLTGLIDVASRATRPGQLRAVDYLRVSTEEQARGYGIAAAGKKTRKHITKKDWDHVGTYADEGYSGSLEAADRPDLKRLMHDAHQDPRPFDMVVVSEGRAIGRTGRAFWRWVWKLEELGIYVAVVKDDYDNSTQSGRKKMRKDADYAEEEREIIRERTQGGIQEKAEEGGHSGGRAPFGWRIENKGIKGESRLVLDGPAVEILRRAWTLIVVRRRSCAWTARVLNRLQGPAPSLKGWTGDTVRGVLTAPPVQRAERVFRDPATAGTSRGTQLGLDGKPLYGETVIIKLPPAFTAGELARLNAALARTARGPYTTGAVHPLSGRLWGACEKHYTGSMRANDRRAYRCSGKTAPRGVTRRCACSQIDASALEGAVWSEVCALLGDPGRLGAMAADWADLASQSGEGHEARIADLEKQVAGQDAALAAVLVAAAKETDAAAAIGLAMAQLKAERVKLVALLEEATAWQQESEAAGNRARDLHALAELARDRLHAMQPAQQAEVLELLDVRITILGPVPSKVRKDDEVAKWFRERNRSVPDATDEAWELFGGALAHKGKGRPAQSPRLRAEAVLHKARTGCSWRNLPAQYGPWESVVGAWRRWHSSGLWEEAMDSVADFPGTALPPEGVALPPLRIEGRVDPRLLVNTQKSPHPGLPNQSPAPGAIRFRMELAA